MAKRKSSRAPAHLVPYQFPRASAPIVVTKTRTVHVKPKKHHRRRSSSVGGVGGSLAKPVAIAIGGYLVGLVDKQGTNIPTIPMLGRAGTLTIALHFLAKQFHSPMVNNAAVAAAAIAGYELGRDGSISGGNVASQT